MNNHRRQFRNAFATVLVILSVISIKMAYIYAMELLLFLVVTIPAAAAIVYLEGPDCFHN